MSTHNPTESEFLTQATESLDALETALTDIGQAADIDWDLHRADNVLTIELPGGSKLIINSQAAMRQLWVAASSGGYHFSRDADGLWRNTRNGQELRATLSELLSAQCGQTVHL